MKRRASSHPVPPKRELKFTEAEVASNWISRMYDSEYWGPIELAKVCGMKRGTVNSDFDDLTKPHYQFVERFGRRKFLLRNFAHRYVQAVMREIQARRIEAVLE